MNKNTSAWLHGLMAALIGGGASAVTSVIVLPGSAPGAFNFGAQLVPLLKNAGEMFLVSGLLSAFLYLKQSPLPPESVEISKTTEEKITVTATPIDSKQLGPRA
jgi:hypothetical protein